jgi:hypothetical protein
MQDATASMTVAPEVGLLGLDRFVVLTAMRSAAGLKLLIGTTADLTLFATGVAELTPGRVARLLDVAEGRSGRVLASWLADRKPAWRGGCRLLARAADGRGVAVVVFDTEEEARAVAARFEVGKPPMPYTPAGVMVTTVEVREVIASV